MHSFLELVQEIKTAYDREDNAVLANIENNIELTTTSSIPHAIGTYLVYNKVIYEVINDIDTGDTLTPGTNITVASDIMSKIAAIESRVAGVENDLSAAEADISEAESNISTLTTGLSAEVSQRQAAVNSLKETLTNNGAHNLLPYTLDSLKALNTEGTWSGNVYTIVGVTYTVNTDSQGNITDITVNTASSATDFKRFYLTDASQQFPAGSYKLSGCIDGSNTTYRMRIDNIDDGTGQNNYTGEINVTIDGTKHYQISIYVNNGKSVSNIKFYPMIRLASDTDTTYTPYAKTNQQLTRETTGLIDNVNQNGAKNYVPADLVTETRSGITVTRNSDDSYSVSGTRTITGAVLLTINNTKILLKANQSYTLSGGATDLVQVILRDEENSTWYLDADGHSVISRETSKTFTNGNTDTYVNVCIRVNTNDAVNATVYPMLRLASDLDDTFVPGAFTNRQLTDVAEQVEGNAVITELSGSIQVNSDGVKTYKQLLSELASAILTKASALPDNYYISPKTLFLYIPERNNSVTIHLDNESYISNESTSFGGIIRTCLVPNSSSSIMYLVEAGYNVTNSNNCYLVVGAIDTSTNTATKTSYNDVVCPSNKNFIVTYQTCRKVFE